ncbi:unnamed protein product, partial [marine sediment metagenome]
MKKLIKWIKNKVCKFIKTKAMNENFEKAVKVILKCEGLYVDHPKDPGKATNLGISLRFLRNIGDYNKDGILDGDLDQDGDIDEDDIRLMTQGRAEQFYHDHFWKRLRCDNIECKMMRLHLFDMGVNAGTSRAAKIVQKLLAIKEDGIIGPVSLSHI